MTRLSGLFSAGFDPRLQPAPEDSCYPDLPAKPVRKKSTEQLLSKSTLKKTATKKPNLSKRLRDIVKSRHQHNTTALKEIFVLFSDQNFNTNFHQLTN